MKLENIKNNISEDKKIFFKKIINYIEEKIYFFGSIQRYDYIDNLSDIDIIIISDNEISTINKLSSFLNISNKEFKKIIFYKNDFQIYGYKYKYKNNIEFKNLKVEFVIYNSKFKQIVINEAKKFNNLPFFLSYLLYILKIIYYYTFFLSKDNYISIKNYLMNEYEEDKTKKFIVLK